MSTLNPTTLMEAVNSLLLMIGEAPVNSLEGQQYTPAAFAYTVLSDVTRQIQLSGLHFNTDREMKLFPDVNTEMISVPQSAARIDASDRTKDIVVRNKKLYDKDNQTYIFTDPIECDIVWFFSFDEMPEHVRQYVTIRAGRIFQNRMVGSKLLYQLTEEEELAAETRMNLVEMENKDSNFLQSGPMLQYGTQNRGRFW